MMSLRILCVVASIACIQGAMVRRDLGKSFGGYGAAPPAPSYGAPAAAPSYGVPPPAPAYGAPAPPSYGPIFFLEEEKPDLKAKFNEFKSKIIGTIGYVKGSLLAAKGQLLLKKANMLNEKGEKLVGLGEQLKALRQAPTPAVASPPVATYYPAPAPAPAPASALPPAPVY